MYDTITTPLSTATPKSAMNPTAAEMLKGMSAQQEREHAADRGQRDAREHEQRLPHRVERREEQQEDQEERQRHDDQQARPGALEVLELAAELDAVARRAGVTCPVVEEPAHVVDEAADVAPAHVALHEDQAGAVDVADLGRPLDLLDPGQ